MSANERQPIDFFDHREDRNDLDGNKHDTSRPYFQEGLSWTGIRRLIQRCEAEGMEFDIFPMPGQAYGQIMFVWHSRREEGSERPGYRMFSHQDYTQP